MKNQITNPTSRGRPCASQLRMPPPELEPTPRSLTIWGKGKPCCLFFPQHCQKAHALRALRTTLTAGLGLRMPSDRPLPGAKVAACWILLSLCKYAPDLNLPAKGSCAEPNSKQFVLLPPLRFCVLEEALKKNRWKRRKARPFLSTTTTTKQSAAEVRSCDPLQLPEELKRDVCAFVADVWICAIAKAATLRDSKSPTVDLKGLCFGATAAFLRGCSAARRSESLSLSSHVNVAVGAPGWTHPRLPEVNAPRAADIALQKSGAPGGGGVPFLHPHRDLGVIIRKRRKDPHIHQFSLLFA